MQDGPLMKVYLLACVDVRESPQGELVDLDWSSTPLCEREVCVLSESVVTLWCGCAGSYLSGALCGEELSSVLLV